MTTEKDIIKCEAVFNEDKTHRVLWKQVWNKDKPLACVIMINPCQANTVVTDMTTFLTVNNIYRLGDYGGVAIVNLFSLLTTKLRFNSTVRLNDEANDSYIKKAAEESSVVILAWGKSSDTNLKIAERAREVIDLLSVQKEKFRIIGDGQRKALHPLTPSVRSKWFLVDATEWIQQLEEPMIKKDGKAKALKEDNRAKTSAT